MEVLFVIWEGEAVATSDAARAEAVSLMGAYVFDLLGKGKLKGGAPLRPASEAVTVRAKEGKPLVVDGPYAETKDVIGGYFVVEVGSSPDTALELVDDLISGDLARYPLAWATRADMRRRLGRHQDSAADYRRAAALTGNGAERRFLTSRAERCERGTDQEVG